jgi:hypothetical protein
MGRRRPFATEHFLAVGIAATPKGVLPKDLAQDFKKVEKLAKRLRQEIAQ